MPNGNFRKRLRGELFREGLGQKLAQAKRNGEFTLSVSHGNGNRVYAHITVGARPGQDDAQCGNRCLIRRNVRDALRKYVRIGHGEFFNGNNLNAEPLAKL